MVHRIKALAEALEGSAVSELDLTESGTRIVIRRRMETPLLMPVYANGTARASRATHSRVEDIAAASVPDPTVAVLAPLTGVFYAAPSPSSAPFVQVGDTIQAGQTVCIVEAMKVFNEIQAEVSGTVTAIVVQPGKLVHKGDALIRVQPM